MLMISLVFQKQGAADRPMDKQHCMTLSIGRSSYYHGRRGRPFPVLELWDRIHWLFPSWHSYCYSPMTRALRCMGYYVNHKGVMRLKRDDNLLASCKKAFYRPPTRTTIAPFTPTCFWD